MSDSIKFQLLEALDKAEKEYQASPEAQAARAELERLEVIKGVFDGRIHPAGSEAPQ